MLKLKRAAVATAMVMAVAATPAGATTLDFEAAPPAVGDAISDQYAHVDDNLYGDGTNYGGITFNSGNEQLTSHSQGVQLPVIANAGTVDHDPGGSRVLGLNPAANGEPADPANIWATFDRPRSSVSLWVYQRTNYATSQTSFTLTGFDGSGAQVAQDIETVTSAMNGGSWTQLSLSSSGNPIQDITLIGALPSTTESYYVDDVAFSDPPMGAAPEQPHFNISTDSAQLNIGQGGSATATIRVRRFGGSTGPIDFSSAVSGLPPGVNAAFVPAAADTPDRQTTLELAADPDAPTTNAVPFTISPTPSSSSGTGNSIGLSVRVTPLCVSPPQFSVVRFVALDGCFHPAGRRNPGTLEYTGHQIRLNGMVIDVTGLAVTPNSHHISALNFMVDPSNLPASAGIVRPLYVGPMDVNIPNPGPGDDSVPLVAINTDMLQALAAPFHADPPPRTCHNGLDTECPSDNSSADNSGGDGDDPSPGSVSSEINLTSDGAEAPIGITLPSALGGLSAEATLKWKNDTGYDPHAGFKFRLNQVPLGPAKLGPLELSHDGAGTWNGTAGLQLPPPLGVSFEAEAGWDPTGLRKLRVTLDHLHIPFIAGSFLTKVGIHFASNPPACPSCGYGSLGFGGELGVEWGPQVHGKSLVGVDGTVDVTIGLGVERSAIDNQPFLPFDIQVGAHLMLVGIDVGHADLEIAQDNQGPTFRLAAELGVGLPYVQGQDPQQADMYLGGHILFWVQPPHFDGEAGLMLKVLGVNIASADALISDVGFGVCGHIGPFTGGAGERWGGSLNVMGPLGCDISDYRPAYRQPNISTVSAGHTLSYPAGSKPVYLKLYGVSGTPKVTLTGPGGRRLVMPLAGHAPIVNNGFLVLQQPSQHLTIIGINNPGGTWRLTPETGSSPIRVALGATTLPPAHVTGHVTGQRRTRTLTYSILARPHQHVTFAEIGSHTHRVIGTARGTSGRLRFTPGYGPRGARRIVAIVDLAGIPDKQITIASYVAPAPPAPVDPSGVIVSRSRLGVLVSWRAGTQVAEYRVNLIAADGTHLFKAVPAGRTSVRFIGVPAVVKVRATVQAERLNGGFGSTIRSGKPAPACKPSRRHRCPK